MIRLISKGVPSKNSAGRPRNSSIPGALKVSPSPSKGRMTKVWARVRVDSAVSRIRASVRSECEVIGVNDRSQHYQLDGDSDESAAPAGEAGST